MTLTNKEIYEYTINLNKEFSNSMQLPIKINFYLQKNKKLLLELAQDIEESRLNIIKKFGKYDEEIKDYIIPDENYLVAAAEMEDLLNLEQNISLYKINIADFDEKLILSTKQMEALMFMIEE